MNDQVFIEKAFTCTHCEPIISMVLNTNCSANLPVFWELTKSTVIFSDIIKHIRNACTINHAKQFGVKTIAM